MNFEGNPREVIQRVKNELARMKEQVQPGDTIPPEVFFMLMDSIVPSIEKLIDEKENNEPSTDNPDSV